MLGRGERISKPNSVLSVPVSRYSHKIGFAVGTGLSSTFGGEEFWKVNLNASSITLSKTEKLYFMLVFWSYHNIPEDIIKRMRIVEASCSNVRSLQTLFAESV